METQEAKKSRLKKILEALRKKHPDAKLALDFSNPLELLIALILAAQARDDLVNLVTAGVFAKYQTAAAWAGESEAILHEQLRRINFYRNKTRSIQKACQMLVDDFGGQVPDTLENLLKLPGVGRKTANIILGNAFHQPAIGVDTHVARLAQRLGFTAQDDPDKIEADLTEIVPKKEAVAFCHLLQFHGRRICIARKPACGECPVARLCPSAVVP